MSKRLLTTLIVTVFVGAVTLFAAQQAPDTLVIQSKLWNKHTKSAVTLSHKKHSTEYNNKCIDCHHIIKDGKNVWKEGDEVQKCMECHNESTIKGEKKLSKDKQKLNLKLSYHSNCQGCHKKLKKQDKKKYSKIPTTCVKCHPKK